MSAVIPLGNFERVSVRDAWPTEDGNFTPWLAEAGNIALLGTALKMELEVEAIEQPVGSFRADILARALDDTETEQHRVIIENQFARTDHGHLGQILTYLAGIEDVKTVVWIAETIQADHRAAIDWLNENTTEQFSFFAIEIELWRIGISPPAPRFNVIASPNDWARTTRKATREVAAAALGEVKTIRSAYWTSFSKFLKERDPTFQILRPNVHWRQVFPIGPAGFSIRTAISTGKRRMYVYFFVRNIHKDKTAFRTLHADKNAIQREFGEILEWEEMPEKKVSRIGVRKDDVDLSDEQNYPEMHAWMLSKMEKFRNVFAARAKSLPATSTPDAPEDDDSSEE